MFYIYTSVYFQGDNRESRCFTSKTPVTRRKALALAKKLHVGFGAPYAVEGRKNAYAMEDGVGTRVMVSW